MYLFEGLNQEQCHFPLPFFSFLSLSLWRGICLLLSRRTISFSFDFARSIGRSLFVPNMEAITASLERSLQNCSLNNNNNNHQTRREDASDADADADADAGLGISSSSDDVPHNHNHNHISNSDTTLDLNSHISLPYHWEQCLDLKTGEIYYINWRNGMKAKEDPRRVGEYSSVSRDYESDDEEEEGGGGEEEGSWYDSEESSSECSSKDKEQQYHQLGQVEKQNNNNNNDSNNNNVLVVAGCKGCLMYFMVPKHVQQCPKCTAQLLHFDRSQNAPSP